MPRNPKRGGGAVKVLLIVLILLILIVLAVILVLLILIVQRHVTLSFHSGLPLLFHIFRFLYNACGLPFVFHFFRFLFIF